MKIVLSKPEARIVVRLQMGMKYEKISRELGIPESTARRIMHGAFKRLGCNSRVELLVAIEQLEAHSRAGGKF